MIQKINKYLFPIICLVVICFSLNLSIENYDQTFAVLLRRDPLNHLITPGILGWALIINLISFIYVAFKKEDKSLIYNGYTLTIICSFLTTTYKHFSIPTGKFDMRSTVILYEVWFIIFTSFIAMVAYIIYINKKEKTV